MNEKSVLLRTRVPADRLRRAEGILQRLGMKPGDAVNLLMAQIELRQGLPFEVALKDPSALSAEFQAREWAEALGEY